LTKIIKSGTRRVFQRSREGGL